MQTSRRNFLRATAVASAASLSTLAMGSALAAPTAAVPCPAPLPEKWDKETDLVVVGSGIAGMSAAIAALDKGAKVLVFEKGKNYGGCAIINGGIMSLGGGTRTQREHGVVDTPELLYQKLTNPKHHEYRKNNKAIVKHYAEMCPGTQEWLEAHGVKFLPTFTQPGQYDSQHHESYHHIWWKDSGDGAKHAQPSGGFRTGRGVMMPFYEYFTGHGGEIFLEHRVLDVIKDPETGRVVGAIVEQPDGSTINVKANKGVVLAGGSWKANPELRKLTDPRFTENMISTGYPLVAPDGSAILIGLRAGALFVGDKCEDTPHLRRVFGTHHYGFPKGSKYGKPGLGISGPRWAEVIFTNKDGNRFVMEVDKADLGGYSFYDMALAQPEQLLWVIFDNDTAKKYKWDTSLATCEEGDAFDADTIEELAQKTNQPDLAKTIEKYNKFVDQKKDEDFGKPEDHLTKKIENGPFHAARLVLAVHNLTGGLAINENAQCIDQNAKPIPGLYAAGETAGGLYVGNGMPRAIMPGRFAGEHAAGS